MKRILIPNMGPDPRTPQIAIALGLSECQSIGSRDLGIITPAKNNLDGIAVGEYLGVQISKRLMKGEKVQVNDSGIHLVHESVKTLQKGSKPAVCIAFYVSSDDILKLDGMGINTLIFVPWLDQDGVDWATKWNAITHGSDTVSADVDLPDSVIESLDGLTVCVNLSTGLAHPSDLRNAKNRFSELRSEGIRWDPNEIEKWAVRNGWKPNHAQELAKLSAKYTK